MNGVLNKITDIFIVTFHLFKKWIAVSDRS